MIEEKSIDEAIEKLQSANNAMLQAFCAIPFPNARMQICEAQKPLLDAMQLLQQMKQQIGLRGAVIE